MHGRDQQVTLGVMFFLDPRGIQTVLSAGIGKQSHGLFSGLSLPYFIFLKGGKVSGDTTEPPMVDWQFYLSFLKLIPSENGVGGGE